MYNINLSVHDSVQGITEKIITAEIQRDGKASFPSPSVLARYCLRTEWYEGRGRVECALRSEAHDMATTFVYGFATSFSIYNEELDL